MNNNENEKGFSTPQALAFIFSLCLMTLTFCIAVASSEKKINSYKKESMHKKTLPPLSLK